MSSVARQVEAMSSYQHTTGADYLEADLPVALLDKGANAGRLEQRFYLNHQNHRPRIQRWT